MRGFYPATWDDAYCQQLLERFADHVAIINQGKILHAGPMDKVIEPFCIVDFTLPTSHPLSNQEGITLIQRLDPQHGGSAIGCSGPRTPGGRMP